MPVDPDRSYDQAEEERKTEWEQAQHQRRLAAASGREIALAEDLGGRQQEETARVLAEQTAQAQQSGYGMAAMAGADPSRLRAGSYGATNVGLQGAAELELQQQLNQQAYQQSLIDAYARQSQYTGQAIGMEAGEYAWLQQQREADMARKYSEDIAKRQMEAQATGIAMKTAGTVAAMAASDQDLKTAVKKATPAEQDKALREIYRQFSSRDRLAASQGTITDEDAERYRELSAVPTYTYQYRPGAGGPGVSAPPGRHFGPMAQELERTEIGRGMVVDTPYGKAVDPGAASLGALGLSARAIERQDEMDQRLRAVEALRYEVPELSDDTRAAVTRMTGRGY